MFLANMAYEGHFIECPIAAKIIRDDGPDSPEPVIILMLLSVAQNIGLDNINPLTDCSRLGLVETF